jgi:hypothetical protein
MTFLGGIEQLKKVVLCPIRMRNKPSFFIPIRAYAPKNSVLQQGYEGYRFASIVGYRAMK